MKNCIAIEASRLGIISQYTLAYCDAGDKRQGWAVSQYNPAKPATRPGIVPVTRHRSWALGVGALGVRGERAHGRWARRASGRERCARQADAGQARCRRARAVGWRHGRAAGKHTGRDRRAGHGRLGGLGTAWACNWANGLCTWCTQPVLTLFDSLFFLSH